MSILISCECITQCKKSMYFPDIYWGNNDSLFIGKKNWGQSFGIFMFINDEATNDWRKWPFLWEEQNFDRKFQVTLVLVLSQFPHLWNRIFFFSVYKPESLEITRLGAFLICQVLQIWPDSMMTVPYYKKQGTQRSLGCLWTQSWCNKHQSVSTSRHGVASFLNN